MGPAIFTGDDQLLDIAANQGKGLAHAPGSGRPHPSSNPNDFERHM